MRTLYLLKVPLAECALAMDMHNLEQFSPTTLLVLSSQSHLRLQAVVLL